MAEEPRPIVGIRVVERVRSGCNNEGFSDLIATSQRIQIRRQGDSNWEEVDLVIERADDRAREATSDSGK